MNRHQRRLAAARSGHGSRDIATAAREATARLFTAPRPGLAAPVPESVALTGGPMDGWVVKPDAGALRTDWYAGYAEAMRLLGKEPAAPGRYGLVTVDEAGVRRSAWQAIA